MIRRERAVLPTQRPDVAVLLPDLRGGGTERVRLILVQEFVLVALDAGLVVPRRVHADQHGVRHGRLRPVAAGQPGGAHDVGDDRRLRLRRLDRWRHQGSTDPDRRSSGSQRRAALRPSARHPLGAHGRAVARRGRRRLGHRLFRHVGLRVHRRHAVRLGFQHRPGHLGHRGSGHAQQHRTGAALGRPRALPRFRTRSGRRPCWPGRGRRWANRSPVSS